MKQIFFFILIGLSTSLFITSCNNKKVTDNGDSLDKFEKVSIKNSLSDSLGMSIAFYYQDSIASKFRFYVEIDSMLKAKESAYHNELEKKIKAYQAYEADIQKRLDNNEITGYQIEDIQRTALQKQQAIQQYEQQRGEELQRETLQYQMALMNKIAQAGKEFSENKGIDLLFFYQKGGQITFINNALDVTDEFINYLNKREDELKLGFEEELEALENEPTEGGLK